MTTIAPENIGHSSSSSPAASVDAQDLSSFDATELELPIGLQGRVSRGSPPLTDPEQAYFWSPSWQAAERAAAKDLEAGRFREFESIEDAARWLLADY